MKKIFYILTAVLIIIASAFVYGKWDQLKYYFKLDNTEISRKLVDFPENDELKIGQPVDYVFDIANIGSNELNIENVLTECDCLITSMESKTIDIGKTTKVTIQFTPEKQGVFTKYAVIEANTAPPLTVMTIKGEVK